MFDKVTLDTFLPNPAAKFILFGKQGGSLITSSHA